MFGRRFKPVAFGHDGAKFAVMGKRFQGGAGNGGR